MPVPSLAKVGAPPAPARLRKIALEEQRYRLARATAARSLTTTPRRCTCFKEEQHVSSCQRIGRQNNKK